MIVIPGNPVVSSRKGWDNDGLCNCILGWRPDLRGGADSDGEDENEALESLKTVIKNQIDK